MILQKKMIQQGDSERLIAGCSFKQGKEKNCGKKVPKERKKREKSWARSAGELEEWAYEQVTGEERRLETQAVYVLINMIINLH